ncbi:hypothetical protein [Spiroplasma taiwanense]|uniref:Uncharacterized protein n=1 Tax=Spiroplasma taiwanense CT-1 TaxID=1276220 RepID=S5LZS4_9MOLU|nr:hypothetical protein [Spiroplasma taiwanense]AGR41202.1 hypothetical protein STAIW_v1c05800 [Spiroplasma taiwanense CT-1]
MQNWVKQNSPIDKDPVKRAKQEEIRNAKLEAKKTKKSKNFEEYKSNIQDKISSTDSGMQKLLYQQELAKKERKHKKQQARYDYLKFSSSDSKNDNARRIHNWRKTKLEYKAAKHGDLFPSKAQSKLQKFNSKEENWMKKKGIDLNLDKKGQKDDFKTLSSMNRNSETKKDINSILEKYTANDKDKKVRKQNQKNINRNLNKEQLEILRKHKNQKKESHIKDEFKNQNYRFDEKQGK